MILRKPANIWFKKKGDFYYIKNLYSPFPKITALDKKESSCWDRIMQDKFVLNPVVKIKFLLQDILLLPWNKYSNYDLCEKEIQRKNYTFWIHITNDCNLACKYCYLKNSDEVISEKTIERIPELLVDLEEQGYETIKFKFAGGEPFLEFKKLKKLLELIEEKASTYTLNTKYTIITNGTIVSDNIINFIKSNSKITLAISLDGIKYYHDKNRVFPSGRGSYSTIRKNINRYIEHEIKPYFSITVTRESLRGLPKALELISQKNSYFSVNFVRDSTHKKITKLSDDAKKFANDFIKAVKTYTKHNKSNQTLLNSLVDRARLDVFHYRTCSIEKNYAIVDCKGNLHKCQMMLSDKTPVGSIFHDNWIEEVKNQQDKINVSVEKKGKCAYCKWKYLCTGGCPLFTKLTYGTSKHPSPNCEIYKRILPEVLDLEADRMHKKAIHT